MIQLIVAVGLFAGLVWVTAHAIFLLLRHDRNSEIGHDAQDTIARFVEENYGSRFAPDAPLTEQGIRRR